MNRNSGFDGRSSHGSDCNHCNPRSSDSILVSHVEVRGKQASATHDRVGSPEAFRGCFLLPFPRVVHTSKKAQPMRQVEAQVIFVHTSRCLVSALSRQESEPQSLL